MVQNSRLQQMLTCADQSVLFPQSRFTTGGGLMTSIQGRCGKWFCHRSVKGHMADIIWTRRGKIGYVQRDSLQRLESVREKLISFIHTRF